MSRFRMHAEKHLVGRIGWMRAAVLGANYGIISTASLIVGVAAAAAGLVWNRFSAPELSWGHASTPHHGTDLPH